jgi:CRISPR/Cas system-associated protein endoribonuclease Cas2
MCGITSSRFDHDMDNTGKKKSPSKRYGTNLHKSGMVMVQISFVAAVCRRKIQ